MEETKKYTAPFNYTDEELTKAVEKKFIKRMPDHVTITGNYGHDYWDEWWDDADVDVDYYVDCTTNEDGSITVSYSADVCGQEVRGEDGEFTVEDLIESEVETFDELVDYLADNMYISEDEMTDTAYDNSDAFDNEPDPDDERDRYYDYYNEDWATEWPDEFEPRRVDVEEAADLDVGEEN